LKLLKFETKLVLQLEQENIPKNVEKST
jgi:hypothetical protein